jgi:hypothetical protein
VVDQDCLRKCHYLSFSMKCVSTWLRLILKAIKASHCVIKYMYLHTAISIKVVPRAKRKSRIRALCSGDNLNWNSCISPLHVCGVTLSVHPHRTSWKVCLATVGNRKWTRDIWVTNPHKKYHTKHQHTQKVSLLHVYWPCHSHLYAGYLYSMQCSSNQSWIF